MTTRNAYTDGFKQEMIRRLAAGESPKVLSEETGASKRTLEGWKRLATKQGDVNYKAETGELHRLLKENSELKKENSDLKEKYKFMAEENEFLLRQYLSLRKLRS